MMLPLLAQDTGSNWLTPGMTWTMLSSVVVGAVGFGALSGSFRTKQTNDDEKWKGVDARFVSLDRKLEEHASATRTSMESLASSVNAMREELAEWRGAARERDRRQGT